jgi:hypothetical protein
MFKPENLLSIWTLVVFLIIMFICPYMDMSKPDIKGSISGAITLLIAASVLSLVSVIIPTGIVATIQSAMNTFVTYYIYALALGLLANIIMTMCFGVVAFLQKK